VIRIDRPAEIPRILASRGKKQTEKLCRDYDAASADFGSRKRTFTFDEKLYGDRTVKEALVLAQHGKCCFCEQRVRMEGDVEHYRPKGGFCQAVGEAVEGPGYYWLAYEWTNLLLACTICNQRFKRNLFPLADPARRSRSHHDGVAGEDPLFINPAERDPEQYISFRREIPYAIDGNPYGTATIEALGLAREVINERRRDRLNELQLLRELVSLEDGAGPELLSLIEKAKDVLTSAVEGAAEFAAMARAAARSGFYQTI
jgi:uncharacterized protein (TIGR02646 family)